MFMQNVTESDLFLQESIQSMLDECENSNHLIVFQDTKGKVWQLLKRDDFQSFDEMLNTEEDDDYDRRPSSKVEVR